MHPGPHQRALSRRCGFGTRRRPPLCIESSRPGLLHERFREEKLAAAPINRVVKGIAIGLKHTIIDVTSAKAFGPLLNANSKKRSGNSATGAVRRPPGPPLQAGHLLARWVGNAHLQFRHHLHPDPNSPFMPSISYHRRKWCTQTLHPQFAQAPWTETRLAIATLRQARNITSPEANRAERADHSRTDP